MPVFCHFFCGENSVCVKPSLIIVGSSMALKIMKNFSVAYSWYVWFTEKVSGA